jgi:hypothetical protein
MVDYALVSVHSFSRGVLWRRPQWYSAMRYVAVLPRWVRELYCQTTYVYNKCAHAYMIYFYSFLSSSCASRVVKSEVDCSASKLPNPVLNCRASESRTEEWCFRKNLEGNVLGPIKALSQNFPGETEETTKYPGQESRTEHLPNKGIECYRCANQLGR